MSWAIKTKLIKKIGGFRPVIGFDDQDVTNRIYEKTGVEYKKIDAFAWHKIGSFKGFLKRQFTVGMKEISYRKDIGDRNYFRLTLPLRYLPFVIFIFAAILLRLPIVELIAIYALCILFYYCKYLVYIYKEKGIVMQFSCYFFYFLIPILSITGNFFGLIKEIRSNLGIE
ncbi:MAG: hypothetical protein NT129_01215 [Candidatus Aenigmarchaeota archaeon]|nr:hypothetical protein [Candidatus Aenigmarchaeota archaeon]